MLGRETLSLIQCWRDLGHLIPVVKHARFACSRSSSPSLRSVLSTSRLLMKLLARSEPPACRCDSLLARDGSWPSVFYDGSRHVASPQGHVPWPEALQHLARVPASMTLPPRREDLITSIRNTLRKFRDRCRVIDSHRLIEAAVLRYGASTHCGHAFSHALPHLPYRGPMWLALGVAWTDFSFNFRPQRGADRRVLHETCLVECAYCA